VDHMAKQDDNLAGQTTAERKKHIYTRMPSGASTLSHLIHICLQAKDQLLTTSSVMFDIDSIMGYPTSLAVAKQGI
jgi:hypothetical protein